MRKVRVTGMPMQYGGNNNPYIPYVSGMPQAPVTPEERSQWNRVAGQMRQQPGTYVRNWDHNQDFQNQFMQSQGFDPNRVSAIQADMLQRNQSMPGTVTYGPAPDYSIDAVRAGNTAAYGGIKRRVRITHTPYGREDMHDPTKQGTLPPPAQFSGQRMVRISGTPEAMMQEGGKLDKVAPQSRGEYVDSKYSTLMKRYQPWTKGDENALDDRAAMIRNLEGTQSTNASAYPIDPRTLRPVTPWQYGDYSSLNKPQFTNIETPQIIEAYKEGGYIPGGSGGYGNQQPGHGYALDRFWSSPAGYPGATSKVNPYGKVGDTLPEAQDGGDINAEKQERVLGDFDQDGTMELMNVNGPSHAEGGKDVNIPANSFVFSDTKDLKIKDANILAMFGVQPKRGGYTPAEIAKRYDLNKYKAVLSNPDADNYAHTTAQLMSDSYMAKLNKLALIQEQMKGHMGMPNSATNGATGTAKYGGMKGFQYGGSNEENENANATVAQTVNPVYNMYPNVLTADGYSHDRPTADNMQSFIQQSINPRPQSYGKPIVPGDQYDAMRRAGWNGSEDPGTWAQREQPFAVQQAIGKSGMKAKASDAVTGNDLGNTFYGPRWQNFNPQGPDWNPTMQNITAMGNTVPTSNLPADNTPATPTADQKGATTTIDKGSKTVPVGQDSWMGHRINPNFLGNLFNVLQMGQVHKFKPWEPVPQAVIPDVVFMDPTRAIAAQQEEARSASDLDYMGDQRAARATGLARQGIAGKQAADVIGQYTNQNVGIANQANQQAAAITNDLYQRQANRIAELNKAGFLADRDYQREMGRLQAEMIDRGQKEHDNRVKTAWLNKTSPFFNVNPIDQMPDFKSERAQSEFYKQVYGIGAGSGQGSSDKEGAAGKYAQRLMEVYPGLTMAEAAKWARQEMGLMGRESEIYKPGAMVPTMRYTGLPVGSGQPNTYGMPQYAMGGMVEVPKTAKLKKFMRA